MFINQVLLSLETKDDIREGLCLSNNRVRNTDPPLPKDQSLYVMLETKSFRDTTILDLKPPLLLSFTGLGLPFLLRTLTGPIPEPPCPNVIQDIPKPYNSVKTYQKVSDTVNVTLSVSIYRHHRTGLTRPGVSSPFLRNTSWTPVFSLETPS